jgi:O-antigen/teichoic acid export membrane protein
MLRRFFKDSFIYGGANLLSKSVVIFLVPVYARVFTPQELGVLEMIFAFGTIIAVLVPLGISNGVARFLPDETDDASRATHASSGWWFTVMVYLLFALFGWLCSSPLSRLILDSDRWVGTFRVAVAAIVCNGFQYYLQALLRWRLKPKAFVISNFCSMIVMGVVCTTLLLVFKQGLWAVYFSQIVGAAVGGAVAWYHSRDILRMAYRGAVLRKMILYSLPLVPALVGEFVANYIDRIAIKNLMSIGDVGIYGMGYRFASVVSLLMVGFSTAITPLIYTHYRDEETPKELERIFRFFLVCAVPLLAGLALFSREILWLFATPSFYAAAPVIPIMGAAFILFGMYNFAPGLGIAMKTRAIAIIHVFTAALNTALNYVLIPQFGIVGAAVSTLTSALVMFVIYMLQSQRFYPVPHAWAPICTAVALGLGVPLVAAPFFPSAAPTVQAVLVKGCAVAVSGGIVAYILLRGCELKRLRVLVGAREEVSSGA